MYFFNTLILSVSYQKKMKNNKSNIYQKYSNKIFNLLFKDIKNYGEKK